MHTAEGSWLSALILLDLDKYSDSLCFIAGEVSEDGSISESKIPLTIIL